MEAPLIESEARDFRLKINAAKQEIHKEIVGLDEEIDLTFVALLTLKRGNVLAEGEPGTGKTFLFETFPKVFEADFSRIQFTPDLLPFDMIMGFGLFEADGISLEKLVIKPGALFTEFLLADELNRTPHKTQTMLLEASEERQITYEGITKKLSPLFTVLATQNDIEHEGTFGLAEAVADRFLFKLRIPFPSEKELQKIGLRDRHPKQLQKILAREEILKWREIIYTHYLTNQIAGGSKMSTEEDREKIEHPILQYMTRIIIALRNHPAWAVGPSPRAIEDFLNASAAIAFLRGHDRICQEDVKRIALPAARGRFQISQHLAEQMGYKREQIGEMIDKIINDVLRNTPYIPVSSRQ